MFKFAERPLSIGKIYGQGFALYQETFSKVWYLIFASVVLIGIAQAASNMILPVGGELTKLSPVKQLIFGGTSLISFFVGTYFMALVMHRMYALAASAASGSLGGAPVKMSNSCKVASSKWLLLAMANLLILTAFLLGIIAFVLPGIAAVVFLVFSTLAILIDNRSFFAAVKTSCQLVWKNWWRTFTVLLLPGAILVIGALLQQHFRSVVVALAFVVFFTLFDALIYAFMLVQYNDLKLRKGI